MAAAHFFTGVRGEKHFKRESRPMSYVSGTDGVWWVKKSFASSAMGIFLSLAIFGLISILGTNAARAANTCESLFTVLTSKTEESLVQMVGLYQLFEHAQGRTLDPIGRRILISHSAKVSAEYFKNHGIKYSEVLRALPPSGKLQKVFLLEPDSSSKVGRWVAQFKTRFPDHEVIYTPMPMLEGFSAGVHGNKLLLTSPLIFVHPQLSADVLLHELSHLYRQGKVGFVTTDGPEIPSLGKSKQKAYAKFQSFDEPEAYEVSLRIVLKQLRVSIRTRNRKNIETGIQQLKEYSDNILETAGRGVWVASEIIANADGLSTVVGKAEGGGYVIETIIPADGGSILSRWPISSQTARSSHPREILESIYSKLGSENEARVQHFRRFASVIRQLSPAGGLATLDAKAAELWNLFVARPKFTDDIPE